MFAPGFGTEYTDNFCWDDERRQPCDKNGNQRRDPAPSMLPPPCETPYDQYITTMPPNGPPHRDPAQFDSKIYPSIYREMIVRKDDRGKYIDPWGKITSKPDGRRLMYDPSHPDKMYGSQWSSELADANGCYSFPAPLGLNPEIPWTKDLKWQTQGEVGQWPTDKWKYDWTKAATCPPYDGADDQEQYHKYKTQVDYTL